jgi:indole-3-glycerol phosphate synthase
LQESEGTRGLAPTRSAGWSASRPPPGRAIARRGFAAPMSRSSPRWRRRLRKLIAPDLDAARRRREHVEGAGGVSVLTRPDHFSSSLEDLEAVRAAVTGARSKDFPVRRSSSWSARGGRSAALLVACALDRNGSAR